METQHWIETAFDCSYVAEDLAKDLLERCSSIGRMLNSMILKAPAFCHNKMRDIVDTDTPISDH